MSELLPCPFCGSECEVLEFGGLKRWSCSDHECMGHNDKWWVKKDWEKGEQAWNTRHERTCTAVVES